MTPSVKADVLVLGAGPAGIAAAVAAARLGADTLLLEKSSIPGGMSTAGMINIFCGFVENPFFEEVRAALVRPDAQGRLLYEPEEALDFYLDILQAANVRLLLDASVATVRRAGSKIECVTALTRGGMRDFQAKLCIDATGDGQAAFLAGVPFTLGRENDHGMQPMSMMVAVGGVDPAQAEHVTFGMRPEWQGLLAEQVEKGLVPAPAGHVILIPGPQPGHVTLNMTNCTDADGSDPEAYTNAQLVCRNQVQPLLRFLREHIPGYENAYLVKTALYAGVRETRHIHGDYTLTAEDILAGHDFPDWCVRGIRAPINIHNVSGSGQDKGSLPAPKTYAIPFRCLLPQGLDNLLLAGRCISGTHAAHGSYRVMPICFAMGQAAGAAAALCAARDILPRSLPMEALQSKLTGGGRP